MNNNTLFPRDSTTDRPMARLSTEFSSMNTKSEQLLADFVQVALPLTVTVKRRSENEGGVRGNWEERVGEPSDGETNCPEISRQGALKQHQGEWKYRREIFDDMLG